MDIETSCAYWILLQIQGDLNLREDSPHIYEVWSYLLRGEFIPWPRMRSQGTCCRALKQWLVRNLKYWPLRRDSILISTVSNRKLQSLTNLRDKLNFHNTVMVILNLLSAHDLITDHVVAIMQWSERLITSCCSSGLTRYLWTLFQVFTGVKWMLSGLIISALI